MLTPDRIVTPRIIALRWDSWKTTLVDQLLKQSGSFRENQILDDRAMDSMAQERERGGHQSQNGSFAGGLSGFSSL